MKEMPIKNNIDNTTVVWESESEIKKGVYL